RSLPKMRGAFLCRCSRLVRKARPSSRATRTGSRIRRTALSRRPRRRPAFIGVGGGLALIGFALLAGCGGASVQVPPDLPVPLVQPLPLKMGVHLPEELRGYVHRE